VKHHTKLVRPRIYPILTDTFHRASGALTRVEPWGRDVVEQSDDGSKE